jgi:glycosyltransferase involved in cell wall biosynthesis
MTRRPLVSVVVPTLRRPDYLSLALQSILAQTYSPIEIIVSDNASGDETPQVVAKFSAPHLRFRQNPQTVDLYTHVNQCLEEARGDYFVILSDDDLVNAIFIEELVRRMESSPTATIGLTRCEIINKNGQVALNLPEPEWSLYPGVEFVVDWLWKRHPVCFRTLFSMFTRTQLLRDIGGFPIFPGNSNSDNAAFITLALQGDIAFVRNAVFQYRVYGSSYGLSTPYSVLAQSFSSYRTYLETSPTMQVVYTRVGSSKASSIRKGASRGAARYYLRFLASKCATGMTFSELVAAIRAYRTDLEYIKALFLLPFFFAEQTRGRWGLAGKVSTP